MGIARATSRDSRHMRSIAVVTMIFLPGTFSAISAANLPLVGILRSRDHCAHLSTRGGGNLTVRACSRCRF